MPVKPPINLSISLPPLPPPSHINVARAAAARGNTLQRLGTTGKTSVKVSANQNSAGTPTRDSVSIGNTSSRNRTMNINTASAPAPGSVSNINSGTGSISVGNTRSVSNARPTLSIPPLSTPFPPQYLDPLYTPPSLKMKRAPKGALANILLLSNSNSNSENLINARAVTRLNFNHKDDDELTKAIAELIFTNPDDEWSDVNFFVQTDIDKQDKEKSNESYLLTGGTRETPGQQAQRRINKNDDYVVKTYNKALIILDSYNINRDKFESSKTSKQCQLAGYDIRNNTIPCWICGYGTNLFKNPSQQYIQEDGKILTICDPSRNQFECEHILPAALMAFLDYLANLTYPVTDVDMMRSLYDGSCAMCNNFKSNHLYIKNTRLDGTGDFIPDNDELMKDIIGCFLNVQESSLPKWATCVKREEDDKYIISAVTVNADGTNTTYPNLIWAMIHKDLPSPPPQPPPSPQPSSSPSGKRKSSVTSSELRANSATGQDDYGPLDKLFMDLSDDPAYKLILEKNRKSPLPISIRTIAKRGETIQWIKDRYAAMLNRIERICGLLNTPERKANWHTKYTEQPALQDPKFIRRIVFEAVEDDVIEASMIANLERRRNDESIIKVDILKQMRDTDKMIKDSIRDMRPEGDDPAARRRAQNSAQDRVNYTLNNTFLELRARHNRGEVPAWRRRSMLGAPLAPPMPMSSAPRTWGNYWAQTFSKKPKPSRKTRKARKAAKKNTRRK